MKPVLLIDFGSTYTKLTAVDVEGEQILGTASAYTTVQTDINDGLALGRKRLEEKTGPLEFAECYACSSAAGGLRMVTSGLVPDLTGEAARLASLGAGAKVVGLYSFQMTEDDIEEIHKLHPDIFLLVGGTDGGNSECILHNAKMLATLPPEFPVVVAGNRTAARQCQRILEGWEVYICPNVMPKFGVLQIEPTQKQIREIFLNRIIQAKGLSQAQSLLSDILMPTPSAVLLAMELLAKGCEGESGIGDLIGVDVGGATTDVYSMADGMPEQMNTVYKGLPEPFSKRTVEGDIGMRRYPGGRWCPAGQRPVRHRSRPGGGAGGLSPGQHRPPARRQQGVGGSGPGPGLSGGGDRRGPPRGHHGGDLHHDGPDLCPVRKGPHPRQADHCHRRQPDPHQKHRGHRQICLIFPCPAYVPAA